MKGVLARKVQKRILGREIEQAAFPLLVFGLFALQPQFPEHRDGRGRGLVGHLLLFEEFIALEPLAAQRAGAHAAHAAASDIHEELVAARPEFLAEMPLGRRERRIGGGIQIVRVEKAQVVDALGDVFSDDLRVVRDAVEKAALVQPHAHADVFSADGEHGIEVRRLHARRGEHGELELGCGVLLDDGARAGGGQRRGKIGRARFFDGKTLDGGIDRGCDLADIVLIRARIAVKFCVRLPALEALARIGEHRGAVGEARAHERCKALGVALQPLPPIEGERRHVDALAADLLAVELGAHRNGARSDLVVLRKEQGRKNALRRDGDGALEGHFRLRLVRDDQSALALEKDAERRRLGAVVLDLHRNGRGKKIIRIPGEPGELRGQNEFFIRRPDFFICHSAPFRASAREIIDISLPYYTIFLRIWQPPRQR